MRVNVETIGKTESVLATPGVTYRNVLKTAGVEVSATSSYTVRVNGVLATNLDVPAADGDSITAFPAKVTGAAFSA